LTTILIFKQYSKRIREHHAHLNTSVPRTKPKFCLEFCFCSKIFTRILVFKQNSKRILEHTSPCRYIYTRIKPKFCLEFCFHSRILTRILIFKQYSKRILEHTSLEFCTIYKQSFPQNSVTYIITWNLICSFISNQTKFCWEFKKAAEFSTEFCNIHNNMGSYLLIHIESNKILLKILKKQQNFPQNSLEFCSIHKQSFAQNSVTYIITWNLMCSSMSNQTKFCWEFKKAAELSRDSIELYTKLVCSRILFVICTEFCNIKHIYDKKVYNTLFAAEFCLSFAQNSVTS
jgi:hypothetical protein